MNRSKNLRVPALQVAEDIVPIAEFKAHLSERIRAVRERLRPLVVTQNGKAAAVLLAPEQFDRLMHQAQFVAAVQEGLEQQEDGRVLGHDAVGRKLDARFGPLPRRR
jgi:prevent-host-death family protein